MKQQAATPGRGTSTAEVTPGRVGSGEQGEAKRKQHTPRGGPHREQARFAAENLVLKSPFEC